jgi:RecA-family ATPase
LACLPRSTIRFTGSSREAARWAKAEGEEKRGIPYLKEQGFTISDLPEVKLHKSRLHFYNLNDLEAMPDVAWHIKDVLPSNSLAMIYGEPGSGKTFLALDIALCTAYGLPWHSRECEKGAVLYFAGEGVTGMRKRIKAWRKHFRKEQDTPFTVVTGGANLISNGNDSDTQAILEKTHELQEGGVTIRLIVVDTLARHFGAGDENNAKDMSAFIQNCDHIRE